MKMRIGHVHQAAETVTAIINSNRPLPQKGQYRIARLYGKLKPEYDLIVTRRNAMIEQYGHKEMVMAKDVETGEEVWTEAQNFSVPAAKMPEFLATWAEVCAEEIEVAVEPIPLSQLDNVSAAELVVLDDLVKED